MPQARPHRGRASFENGQNFREVGLHQCPSERKGEGVPVRRSMGRLTLNVLLSFAQFEREVTGERIRDKDRRLKEKGHVDGRQCAAGL